MKFITVLIFQLLLVNLINAQDFSYSFAGKDKAKTHFKCQEKMMIRLVVKDMEAKNIEYKISTVSGELLKVNNFIFNVIANGNEENVIIEAFNKLDNSLLGEISVPVHCPEDIQVKFYGKQDGETIERGKITKPIDIQVIDNNHPDTKFEINSFQLSFVANGKVIQINCDFSDNPTSVINSFIDKIFNLKSGTKLYISNVKVNKRSGSKEELINIPIVGMNVILE